MPSQPTILALDLGTKTGWRAVSDVIDVSGVQDFSIDSRFEGGGMRYLRFQRWLSEIRESLGNIDEVYFEEVRRHQGTTAAHVYGGFKSHLMSWCEKRKIPYKGIPVGTIKKFATEKGNASKKMVMQAALDAGWSPEDDNEADAMWLAEYVLTNILRVQRDDTGTIVPIVY